MRIIRAGEHVQHIPGYGMTVRESGVAVAASAGWWEVSGKTCLAAYQPKGAASYAASKVNMAMPGTYDAAEGVAPSWATDTGWTFSWASGQYLTTGGIIPNGSSSVFVRFSDVPIGDCMLFGSRDASGTWFYINCRTVANSVRYFYGGLAPNIGPKMTEGVLGMAGQTGYRNGVPEGYPLGTISGTILPILIGAFNYSGTPTNYQGPGKIIAFAFYNGILSDSEAASLTAAMAAL